MRFNGFFICTRMTQTLTKQKEKIVTVIEDLASSPSRKVDAANNVIRGVKILGLESRNGRYYPSPVLKQAVSLYEGIKVNVDHPAGGDPAKSRSYRERFGLFRNVNFVEGSSGGIFGDFHFNPKHPIAEQFLWDAEHQPESVGFSHNAALRMGAADRTGREVVEQIVRVRHVDLVADPATTRSLFESENQMDATAAPATATVSSDPLEMIVDSIAAKIGEIAKGDGDPKEKIKQIADLLKKQDKIMALLGDKPAEGDVAAPPPGQEHELVKKINGLTQLIEQYQAKERSEQLQQTIESELKESGLDPKSPVHVSEVFAKQLLATESVNGRKSLIADRVALVKVGKGSPSPKSGNGHLTQATEEISTEQFLSRLRS